MQQRLGPPLRTREEADQGVDRRFSATGGNRGRGLRTTLQPDGNHAHQQAGEVGRAQRLGNAIRDQLRRRACRSANRRALTAHPRNQGGCIARGLLARLARRAFPPPAGCGSSRIASLLVRIAERASRKPCSDDDSAPASSKFSWLARGASSGSSQGGAAADDCSEHISEQGGSVGRIEAKEFGRGAPNSGQVGVAQVPETHRHRVGDGTREPPSGRPARIGSRSVCSAAGSSVRTNLSTAAVCSAKCGRLTVSWPAAESTASSSASAKTRSNSVPRRTCKASAVRRSAPRPNSQFKHPDRHAASLPATQAPRRRPSIATVRTLAARSPRSDGHASQRTTNEPRDDRAGRLR